jgi:hypothetical protein
MPLKPLPKRERRRVLLATADHIEKNPELYSFFAAIPKSKTRKACVLGRAAKVMRMPAREHRHDLSRVAQRLGYQHDQAFYNAGDAVLLPMAGLDPGGWAFGRCTPVQVAMGLRYMAWSL